MKLASLLPILESLAPLSLAQSWDNVGLLVGDPQSEITRGLLAIDYTNGVVAESKQLGAQLALCYHPPLFEGRKRLHAGDPVFEAARSNVALYSMHTALDVASGGTNDVMAGLLGLGEVSPLRPEAHAAKEHKLVTFVPPDHVDGVSTSLFAAGAGRIGNYSSCSFRSEGTGTFWGEEGAKPALGIAGRLERVAEVRLECVVSDERLQAVIAALRAAHPYETPAFDLIRLTAPPAVGGMGRRGSVEPTEWEEFLACVKKRFATERVLVAGAIPKVVRTVAVAAGSCGELFREAARAGVDTYVTGELRHHHALEAAALGLAVICLRHSVSERPVLASLRGRLSERAPAIEWTLSAEDRDPFAVL